MQKRHKSPYYPTTVPDSNAITGLSLNVHFTFSVALSRSHRLHKRSALFLTRMVMTFIRNHSRNIFHLKQWGSRILAFLFTNFSLSFCYFCLFRTKYCPPAPCLWVLSVYIMSLGWGIFWRKTHCYTKLQQENHFHFNSCWCNMQLTEIFLLTNFDSYNIKQHIKLIVLIYFNICFLS